MGIFEQIGMDSDYVIIGACGVIILLLILVVVLFAKTSKLNKKYKKFMSGSDGKTLEAVVLERFKEIDDMKANMVKANKHFVKVDETLSGAFQKVGIVKYDAFREMGGKLSFSLALLNDTNDGFVLNSMHSSREGCYTYIKEIIKGEAFVLLAEEEKLAVEEAIKSKNYLV